MASSILIGNCLIIVFDTHMCTPPHILVLSTVLLVEALLKEIVFER